MRWSLAGLVFMLCLPGIVAQGTSHDLVIESRTFGYGPEDWKSGLAGHETADWNASLGGRLDLELRFEPAGRDPDVRWRATATLSDGASTVAGLVQTTGAGRFDARFDIDGQRALPGQPAVPPLEPGTWTVRLEVHESGIPERYIGAAQATIATLAFGEASMLGPGMAPLATQPVPEAVLPHINEAGPGPSVLMNAASAREMVLAVDTREAGRPVTWRVYSAGATTLPSLGPVPGVPLVVPNPGGVAWTTTAPRTVAADGDGVARLVLAGNASRDVFVVAAYDAGALAVFAVGVSDPTVSIEAITPPSPGEEGVVAVAVAVPGPLPTGELYAVSLDGAGILQRVPLAPDPAMQGRAVATLDGRTLRAASGYGLVAIAVDGGGYAGHATFQRAVAIEFVVPVLGAGHAAQVEVVVRQAGDGRPGVASGLALHGELRLQDGAPEPIEVPEGGAVTRTLAFTPAEAGALQFVAVLDSGDIRHTARHGATVLDSDAYEDAQRPWYDPGKYIPAPAVLPVLLAVLLARRKR